ncbi:ATP-binding protein [Pseudomonas alliivorans]|nr:ATP-binding protein [Pseudomonas alliivorans]
MIDLLNMLRYKSEGTDIDFKSTQYRFSNGTEADKSELLKDILAIANAWRDGPGYILLGFKDQRPHPAEVVGIQECIDDSRIQQFVNGKVKPKLTFRYEEHLYNGKTVGIIIIPKQKRPFYLTTAYGKLKSNVVYVRRGSSTDEAEPVETIAMANEDTGRGNLKIELFLLTPENEELPNSFARTYLQFTEEFPDFERPRKPRHPFDPPGFVGLDRDNSNFWRQFGEYTRVNHALIALRFAVINRSGVQLSDSKLEITVKAADDQAVQMLAVSDLPEKPKPTWDVTNHLSVQKLLAKADAKLNVDGSGRIPICHIRLGSLLPGEQARSELLAVIPQAPGRLLLRVRVLGSELPTPIEAEHLIETIGEVLSMDFEGCKKFFIAEKDNG